MIKAYIIRLKFSYFSVAIHIDDYTNPIVGFRMYTRCGQTNDHFLWRMATWPFIITKIPFLANGHGYSLRIESYDEVAISSWQESCRIEFRRI